MAKQRKRFTKAETPASKNYRIRFASWKQYTGMLSQLSDKASSQLKDYIIAGHTESEVLDYAYALTTKYGEASAELACQMYEALATYGNALVQAAEPAATATYGEVARAVRGASLRSNDAAVISSTAGRLVKMASADTMMKNALRDGAQWAWIPSGDTCPYCMMLASRGWQNASDDAIKNGHAQHIHNNCDCTYCVRFSDDVSVEGYDPDALYDEYINAGDTQWERINALRRRNYAANREAINAQKRAAYARRASVKLPDNEGQFETVLPGDNKLSGLKGQNDRLARAHSYPDNEGMFENNPRPRDDGKQTDIIKPRNIMKEMNKSETGAEALKYINDNNIPVTLLYNVDVKPSLMGEYDPVGKRILIYASNTKSAKETALTVIHEAAHARLGGAGTRKSEVICRLDEIKHNKRRNSLTLQDLRNTIKAVNKHKTYSKLPWR